MTSLAGLSKIVVRFSPSSPLARPVREFLARVGCSKARATNPGCEVRAELIDNNGASTSTSASGTVEVISSDKKSAMIDASGLSAEGIVRRVQAVGAAAAAAAGGGPGARGGGGGGGGGAAALASSGPPPALAKQQLETAWGLAGAFDAGTASKVTPP